jgi:hypothetical protein
MLFPHFYSMPLVAQQTVPENPLRFDTSIASYKTQAVTQVV